MVKLLFLQTHPNKAKGINDRIHMEALQKAHGQQFLYPSHPRNYPGYHPHVSKNVSVMISSLVEYLL